MANRIVAALRSAYGASPLPKPFNFVEFAEDGIPDAVAETLSSHARKKIAALSADPAALHTALGLPADYQPDEKERKRNRGILGQLVLGQLAEDRFVEIYKAVLGTSELELEDSTAARNDTDYRVLNGRRRPVFRINIKFHGTLFRNALTMVGLQPEDCFALATYKIKQGLEKQQAEVLPYLFVVVSCPIAAADVGAAISPDLVDAMCFARAGKEKVPNKRTIEERIKEFVIANDPSFAPRITELRTQIASSPWRIFSAHRAHDLLREKLFERVYAVSYPRFARSHPNAEVDMHLSLAEDMIPLETFLEKLAEIGLQGIAGHLERGLI